MRKKKLVMFGAGLQTPGGMTSVVQTLKGAGVFEKYNVEYISCYEGPQVGLQLLVMFRAMWSLLKMLVRGEVALVHAHSAAWGSFWRKSCLCAVARLFRVPYLFNLHAGEFSDFYANCCGPLAKWWVRHTLRHAAAVVSLTPTWKQLLAEIEPEATIVVIGNPVEVPDQMPSRADGANEVLFLGRLREAKGVFDLVHALPAVLAQCPHLRFIFAGDAEAAEVRRLAEQLGVGHAVELPGWVSGAAKQACLERASIFVLPSHFEGLPVGLLEAMAQGIPIVTTPVGGIPDLLQDGVHGLMVPIRTPDALAAAIIRIATDTALRERMVAASYERVRQNYSVEKVVNDFGALYREFGVGASLAIAGTPQQSRSEGC